MTDSGDASELWETKIRQQLHQGQAFGALPVMLACIWHVGVI